MPRITCPERDTHEGDAETLLTFTDSILARVHASFFGKPIYRNSSRSWDDTVGSDITWSSSHTKVIPAEIVPRRLPQELTPPVINPSQLPGWSRISGNPYDQFRSGYARYYSENDPVVSVTGTCQVFPGPIISFPGTDPEPKAREVFRRRSQGFAKPGGENYRHDEFLDVGEVLDIEDRGDTQLVEAEGDIKVFHELTAEEQEMLTDSLREDLDIDSFGMKF